MIREKEIHKSSLKFIVRETGQRNSGYQPLIEAISDKLQMKKVDRSIQLPYKHLINLPHALGDIHRFTKKEIQSLYMNQLI